MRAWLLVETLVLGALGLQNMAEVPEDDDRWLDDDLWSFRPDLRPPKLHIRVNDGARATPGYLFIAPYDFHRTNVLSGTYMAHQMGPHIYEPNGDLIWSGADLFGDRNTLDFKIASFGGDTYLTFVTGTSHEWAPLPQGADIMLDASYQLVLNLTSAIERGRNLDPHEFTIVDDGGAAITAWSTYSAHTATGDTSGWVGQAIANGFSLVDLETRRSLFDWMSTDHVTVSESTSEPLGGVSTDRWDYFHMNAVDKTPSGDYLVSARHTNTIYLVSGTDGSVQWRLGGQNSSFVLAGFSFSRQHDARVLSQNDTVTVVSMLDNAADLTVEHPATSSTSSVLVVALHTSATPMIATLLQRIERPDGRYTRLRGNAQTLDNGHIFAAWSDNAYVSEHTPSGEMVYEASFASNRFATYRTYKHRFTGRPLDTPAVKAFASTTSRRELTTILYASWNGATEVSSWRFYSADRGIFEVALIGDVPRTGFETACVCRGVHAIVFAEALDRSGNSLANSSLAQYPRWVADAL
ncbi:hypothetical protein LTR53_007530 [Teratosphaeriaceae sp. CCFEE 6253]|nr:hypothetical protein LTR53_007530 [Teratosphaeriaceae sp. CCFEE 6253]